MRVLDEMEVSIPELEAMGHTCDCGAPACYRKCCFPPKHYAELNQILCHRCTQDIRLAYGATCPTCERMRGSLERHRATHA